MRRAKVTIALLVALIGDGARAQCNYTVQIITGPPCGTNPGIARGRGLDSHGNVVGYWFCSSGNDRAFRWSAQDGFITLPIPPNTESSRAVGIVDNRIVGHYNIVGDGVGFIGFVLEGSTFTTLFPPAPYNWVEPNAINGNGAVVGAFGHNGTGPFPRAFLWQNGAFVDVGASLDGDSSTAYDINASGAVTGYMDHTMSPPNYRAYIWNNGKVIDLGYPFPECFATEGRAINDHGHICGWWWRPIATPPFFQRRGFFWNGQTAIDLGIVPGFTQVFPYDIANDGTIVGHLGNADGNGPGFIWRNGVFTVLDNQLLHPTAFVAQAYEIATNGQIVALGGLPSTSQTVFLTPVPPEPGDVNCDHLVDVNDLLAVIGAWGQSGVIQDLNQDGTVNVGDLLIVIGNWGN